MALTPGLGFASLRVLLGLFGVGYSLLKADFGEGANISNELLKNILGEAAGNAVYDLLKGGSASALEETAKLLQQGDSVNLNHDLQQAARKAQLTATLLAVRASLAETKRLTANEKPFWSKALGLIRKDEDEEWLNEVVKLWRQKIDGLPDEVPPQNIERAQIINLFDFKGLGLKPNSTPTEVQRQLAENLKEDALTEIRAERYSVSPLPEAAHKLLEEAIKNGWNEFVPDAAPLTSLNLSGKLYRPERKRALINTDKQYDWFSLVCGLFDEEYKTNERVKAAMQKYLLLDIRDRQSNDVLTKDGKPIATEVFFGHIEQFGDSFTRLEALLKIVDAKQDEILGFVKNFIEENRSLHVITHRKLDFLIRLLEEEKALSQEELEALQEANRQAYQREIALEYTPSEVVGSLIDRDKFFVNRDAEREDLKNRLLAGEKMIVIKAFSGCGKTSLTTEVLHTIAPGEQLNHEKVRGIMMFYCRDKDQASLREVCRKTDARLRKAKVASSFTQSYEAFKREARDGQNILPTRLIDKLNHDLGMLGDIWLVFDNFETALDGVTVKDAELREFFVQVLTKTSRLRFLVTSQKSPQFVGIDAVGTLTLDDLPESFAKEFLRKKGVELKAEDIDCGLAEAEEAELDTLLGQTTAMPMRLVSFVGYLREAYLKRGKRLADALSDRSVMADFREHDAKKGSMSLIEKQYQLLNETEQLVLKASSIFPKAVPFAALKSVLPLTLNEDEVLSCLLSSSLVKRIGSSYELLALPKEVIAKQAEKSDEQFSRREMNTRAAAFYMSIRKPKDQWKAIEDLAPQFEAMYHCRQAGYFNIAAFVLGMEESGFLIRAGYARRVVEVLEELVGNLSWDHSTAYSLGLLAGAYHELGQNPKAIKCYEDALKLYRRLNDRANEGIALMGLGTTYMALGDYRRAIELIEQALEIHREVGDRVSEGRTLMNLGTVYVALGEAQKAIELIGQALEIHREVGDREWEGATLGSLGTIYSDIGENRRAIEFIEQALEIHREVGDRVSEGRAVANLGAAYSELGENHGAIKLHEQALEIHREVGDRGYEGRTLANLGSIYSVLGNNQRTIELQEQALEIHREIGDRAREGRTLSNLGNAYAATGEARRAIGVLAQALEIHGEVSDRIWEGMSLGYLGCAYVLIGERHKAVGLYERALEIHRKVNNRVWEGRTLADLGGTYYLSGESRAAIELFEQALKIHRETGDRVWEGKTLGYLGNAYAALSEAQKAIESFVQAIEIHQEVGDRVAEGRALGLLGVALFNSGEKQGVQVLERALEITRQVEDKMFEIVLLDTLKRLRGMVDNTP